MKILLGKLWQPWKLLEFSNTSTLASYKLVSYKKQEKKLSYKKLSHKKQKKKLPSFMYHWVNKCTTFLFWNIRTCLIHYNKHSFVVSIWIQLKHMDQVSAGASFRVVMLGSLSADEQVSQFLPELESGWRALVGSNIVYRNTHCVSIDYGSNWKPKISLFSNVKNSKKKPEWDLK